MATIVTIMDRDVWVARTDILIYVNPETRTLTWIPRDVFCFDLGDRINAAYGKGGFPLLFDSLEKLGFPCNRGVCLRRIVTERLAEVCSITIPVEEHTSFKYPNKPNRAIEEGFKIVDFNPPEEILTGERIHQWIGARYLKAGPVTMGSDFGRILRQQILLKKILEDYPDLFFKMKLLDREEMRTAGDNVFDDLFAVDKTWNMNRIDNLSDVRIDNKLVLVRTEDMKHC